MTIKVEPFKGKIQDLQSGRGRAKSQETMEIEKTLLDSATTGKPFVISSTEIANGPLKARIRSAGGSLKLRVSINELDNDRFVVQATFRDGASPATLSTPAEPAFVEAKPTPRPRRTSKRS